MALVNGRKASFSGTGNTGHIRLPSGRFSCEFESGGSTCALQAKQKDQPDSAFKAVPWALNDGTFAVTLSTDLVFEVAGGLDYRVNCSVFVAAGYIKFDGIES